MTNTLQFTLNDGTYESNKQQVVAVGVNHETGEAITHKTPAVMQAAHNS